MSDELKACPFCGKMPRENSVTLPFDVGGRRKIAQCACGAFLYTGRWNTRPREDALQARIMELEKSLHDQIVEDTERIVSRNERILALEAEITTLREQVRWIPVSERLPEKDGAYIGWDGTLYVGFTWDERFSVMFPNTVTHWMPLPLPPEVE